jgi:DNA replication and repair protein RecF
MALAANRPRDRAAQRSLIGPHRDDLIVTLPSPNTAPQPAASCSTGEQKAMLIAITLAHAGLTGPSPTPRLLLLDEVAAHLDPIRRAALFDQLAGGPAQVWMTGTEATPFAAIRTNLAQWHVADGKVLT